MARHVVRRSEFVAVVIACIAGTLVAEGGSLLDAGPGDLVAPAAITVGTIVVALLIVWAIPRRVGSAD